ncbi:MAG: glycosyltransferase family 2 protein [Nitrospirota bacterium]
MIYVILPIFNEAACIESLITKIKNALSIARLSYKIIAVDDGSKDDSPQILRRLADYIPMAIITHNINRGLGETLRDGFEYAAEISDDRDIIVSMDADGTHEPSVIWPMLQKLNEGYEVVVASRYAKGGGGRGLSFKKFFFSRTANLLMKVFFPVHGLRDYSCGYRAYRASSVKKAIAILGNNFIELKGLGFAATPEILVKFIRLGTKITEVPFILRYDLKEGKSKMVIYETTVGYFILIAKNFFK